MIDGKKTVVVMPAYNAAKTLIKTYREIPLDVVDDVVIVDDNSNDKTLECAEGLNLKAYKHDKNLGYGANQKTCYSRALTFIENILLNHKLSEYHTGYRAFTKEVLTNLSILENSDDFIFDNQIIAQAVYFGYRIGEISAPCRYNKY